jgi:hypothetical protein
MLTMIKSNQRGALATVLITISALSGLTWVDTPLEFALLFSSTMTVWGIYERYVFEE